MISKIKAWFTKPTLKSEIARLQKLQASLYVHPDATEGVHEDATAQVEEAKKYLSKTHFNLDSMISALLVANRWKKAGKPKKTINKTSLKAVKLSDSDQEFLKKLEQAKRSNK